MGEAASRRRPRAGSRSASQVVRENPIKTAATVVAALGVILGAFVTVDDRYAHAADVKQGLAVNRLTNEVGQLRIERALLQQRLSELQRAGPRARAAYEKAVTDLAALDTELAAKRRQLDRLLGAP